MLDLQSILSYIESVKTQWLSGADAAEVDARIAAIRAKQADGRLYLAVVGEFNSGKSTFINALLGRRLLKDAVRPTTACATYIECQADELAVDVTFFDGSQFHASEADFRDLRKYLYNKYLTACLSLPDVIAAITSDQSVAKRVKSLTIKVPGTDVPRDIVIIDTPGFNPGEKSVDNHSEITREVVERIADAAIVLTPQEQAMSATLLTFLRDNLSRCLHRCTYVVAKIDTVDEDDRHEILDYSRQRIAKDLGVANPELSGLSAVTMLPVKQIPPGMELEWPQLRQEFADFMSGMWTRMERSKSYALAEHVAALVRDVAEHCAKLLGGRREAAGADLAFLRAHGVEEISKVTDQMMEGVKDELADAFASVRVSFSGAKSEARQIADQVLETAEMSESAFRDEIMPSLRRMITSKARGALKELNLAVSMQVRPRVKKRLKTMSEVFASHYSEFPALRPASEPPKLEMQSLASQGLNDSDLLSAISALESEQDSIGRNGAAGGAMVGAAFGPLGILAGGLIGWGLGALFGNRADEMRSRARSQIAQAIDGYFSDLEKKARISLVDMRDRYHSMFKKYAERHKTEYSEAVKKLQAEHSGKVSAADGRLAGLNDAYNTLGEILDNVEHEIQLLKIKQ